MASQNPSSVPIVLPTALSPVANYVNNDTPSWIPGVMGIPTTHQTFGTASAVAIPANATASAVPNAPYIGGANGPILTPGTLALVTVLSNTLVGGASSSLVMSCYVNIYVSGATKLLYTFNSFSSDSDFYLAPTGGNTLAIWSVANSTKSVKQINVVTQNIPVTASLLA